MRNTQHEIKKYRDKYVVTETYVDGELFKIKEEYMDDEGEIIYIYEYFPTSGQMLKSYNEKENKKKDKNKKKRKGTSNGVQKKNKNRKRASC